ncbi:MAG: rod-binding protein [Desulfobacterales bacterium]|nr:rod-binding protein [Desulfobacterales bacterium]
MTDRMDMISEIHSPPPAPSPQTAAKDAKLRQACADFEAIFLHYILKSARKALPQDGFLGNTHESKVYRSMMDQEMARAMARGRGLGLGRLLYQQLDKTGNIVTI